MTDDEVPTDDDGAPLGWPMRPLLDRALPKVKPHKRTPELVAYALAEPDEFAVEAALVRGWCSDVEADRWSTIGLLLMPWHVWPSWCSAGLHPLDRLYPLEAWWRPAWEWAQRRSIEPAPGSIERAEAAA